MQAGTAVHGAVIHVTFGKPQGRIPLSPGPHDPISERRTDLLPRGSSSRECRRDAGDRAGRPRASGRARAGIPGRGLRPGVLVRPRKPATRHRALRARRPRCRRGGARGIAVPKAGPRPGRIALRLWNYFPGINHGEDDRERYRRFCVGRGRALEAAGLNDASMCAATAIGSEQPVMQLVALAGVSPGISIENPRQVSAWNYPRRYGPRQPAFARATGIDLESGRVGLLISGTASVIGHATAHPGDALAQTDEAASNLDALLGHAAGVMNRPALGRFNGNSLARVYVRNAQDWPAVEQRLRRRWPSLRLCGLRGDICRDNLAVEIEAWHTA